VKGKRIGERGRGERGGGHAREKKGEESITSPRTTKGGEIQKGLMEGVERKKKNLPVVEM